MFLWIYTPAKFLEVQKWYQVVIACTGLPGHQKPKRAPTVVLKELTDFYVFSLSFYLFAKQIGSTENDLYIEYQNTVDFYRLEIKSNNRAYFDISLVSLSFLVTFFDISPEMTRMAHAMLEKPYHEVNIPSTMHSRYLAITFFSYESQKVAVTRPLGRAVGVFQEFRVWPKFYLQMCSIMCTIVLYFTAIYRESIVL